MNVETIITILKNSALCESQLALEILLSGAELDIDDSVIDVATSGILETYRIRSSNISEKTGAHANRLAKSTIEFVRELEDRNPSQLKIAQIIPPDQGRFLIWYEPESGDLVGCCYVIQRNEVNEKMWRQMWGST